MRLANDIDTQTYACAQNDVANNIHRQKMKRCRARKSTNADRKINNNSRKSRKAEKDTKISLRKDDEKRIVRTQAYPIRLSCDAISIDRNNLVISNKHCQELI